METFLLPGRISSSLNSAVGLTPNPVCVSKAHDRDEGRCAEVRAGVPGVNGDSSVPGGPGWLLSLRFLCSLTHMDHP